MTTITARPAELTGRIVRAGDVDYPVASAGYNRLFAHDPAVIVFAQETQDVVNALAWARARAACMSCSSTPTGPKTRWVR